MNTFADVFRAFGGPARYAEAIGIKGFHAQTMKTRDSIPPTYWPRTVKAAGERRIKGVSFEVLARIAARKSEMAG